MKRHINRISWMPAKHMVAAVVIPTRKAAVCNCYLPWREIPISGLAELEVDENVEKNRRLFAITLKARMADRYEFPDDRLAFRLHATDGTCYIFGDEHFSPLVTQTDRAPSRVSDDAACQLTVSMKSAMPLLTAVGPYR